MIHVPAWNTAQVVSGSPIDSETLPHVAVSSTGKAVVVYERGSGLWSSLYDPATKVWSNAAQIDGRNGSAGAPLVADRQERHLHLAVWPQDTSST